MTNAMANNLRVLIMAGGTGGHVFPALSVAEELRERGAVVDWLGTGRGIENRLVPAANIPLHLLKVEGVRGRGILGLIKAPFLVSFAVFQAVKLLRQIKPQVVIGFGGFASGPGGLAAKVLAIPLVIHEQNAVAGTTNRLLAKFAQRVLCAFPHAFKKGRVAVSAVVGNPVRKAIQDLPLVNVRYAARAAQKAPLHLLVLGGSLGAKAINELVPQALAELAPDNRPEVWHQTGTSHQEGTAAGYAHYKVEGKVEAFIDDMASAYAWADMVICRAGALTVSEIMMAGVASVLIPLPSAIDDHQTWNAKNLTEAGAGIAVAQADLSAAKLAALLLTQFADRNHLMVMAEKARELAQANSAAQVADSCVEVALG